MGSTRLAVLLAGLAAAGVVGCSSTAVSDSGELLLRRISETPLTGGAVRFDYTALDAGRGLLFVAHMGAGQLVEVDVHAHSVVRTLGDLPDVHGAIVVPDKHRVYATATGRNQMVAVDEDSGVVVFTFASKFTCVSEGHSACFSSSRVTTCPCFVIKTRRT